MKKLWKKFDALSEKCYPDMVEMDADIEVWNKTFSVLLDIIQTGRSQDKNFAPELMDLDDSTDYKYNVIEWIEDYLIELEMREQYDKIYQVCNKLIDLFQWKEESPSDLRMQIALALNKQGKHEEALSYCENWYKEEQDNIYAATALVYARTAVKDFAGAEKIVKQYIDDDTECTEDNDILFMAAAELYDETKNKKAQKRIKQAIEKYENDIDGYLENLENIFDEMLKSALGDDIFDEDMFDDESFDDENFDDDSFPF